MKRDIVQRHIDLVFEDMVKISLDQCDDLMENERLKLFDSIVEIRDLLEEVENRWLHRIS